MYNFTRRVGTRQPWAQGNQTTNNRGERAAGNTAVNERNEGETMTGAMTTHFVNSDHVGRTASGRFTRRPIWQMTADDYPPDSLYWERRFDTVRVDFERKFGRIEYRAWADETWPGNELDGLTWRQICEAVEQEIEYRAMNGQRECTCTDDRPACPYCRQQARRQYAQELPY